MVNTQLIRLLQELDRKELESFQRFVDSPYHNQNARLCHLAQLILAQAPDWEQLNREALDQAMFPGESFQYPRITNYLSDLKKLLEAYLVHERIQQDPVSFQLELAQAAQERSMDFLFEQTDRKLRKRFDQWTFHGPSRIYQQYQLEDTRYVYLTGKQRRPNQSLLRINQQLHHFYVASMLEEACKLINFQNVLQEIPIPDHMQRFIDNIQTQKEGYQDQPHIQLYVSILGSLLYPDEKSHYQEFKQLLTQYESDIPHLDLFGIYQYAQNYCIKQANQGQSAFLRELFVLYQNMIENGLIFYQDYIPGNYVKNIVSLGVRLGEFEWTEYFLDQYADQIEPEQQEAVLAYNRAYLLYGKGESRAAMRLLVHLEFEDVYYYLGTKTLLLKIYFELEEETALISLFHSFAASLRRNKLVSGYQRKVHLNLIRFTRKLTDLRSRSYSMRRKQLLEAGEALRLQIEKTQAISNISWLQDRLARLINMALI
ncbi:MAG: hypothetical protein AAF206_29975 [Bacteroidota bacterium]